MNWDRALNWAVLAHLTATHLLLKRQTVSLKNVLHEAENNASYIKSLTSSTHLFCVTNGTCKVLCCLPKFPGCLEKSICAVFELWAKWAAFFQETLFLYLKLRFIDKLWLFRFVFFAELFSKINDLSLLLQEHD